MFRSESLRLAALYTAAFALSVILLGVITLFSTRQALLQQFEARIRAESAALVLEYRSEGLTGVIDAVHERDGTPGSLDFGLRGPGGQPLAGRLSATDAGMGWSLQHHKDRRGEDEAVRVLTVALPDGYKLLVGDEEERIEALDGAVVRGLGLAFIRGVLLGVLRGYAVRRDVH